MSDPERGPAGDTRPDPDPADLSPEEAEARAAEAAAEAARAKVLRLREAAAATRDAGTPVTVEDADTGAVADDGSDDDEADDDEDEWDEADGGGRRGTLLAVTKYAAAILAVVGVAALASTSAWIMVKHRQADQQRDLNADFSAAARQGVVSLMSLNFKSAKQDVQRILDNSTGEFRKDFEEQSGDFANVAESSKVITEATVTATAVKTMTADTADVLVSAFSTVTNAEGAKEDPRTWRLIVSMARDGEQIKMAKVEFAP